MNAVANPLSCTIAHEDPEKHILPSSAKPKVSQRIFELLEFGLVEFDSLKLRHKGSLKIHS